MTNKKLKAHYRPDFLIENKIIVEIKALPIEPKYIIEQLYDYLHNSVYELGYLINFAERFLKPHRVIYTAATKQRKI